ncbi:MAG: glycoside hydrolase family 32 protein, partial [Actinomycetota bacterium]
MTGHGGAEARRRPEVHFTPPANWLNDPNGLVVLDGVYHLFYQHNPETPVWGNLHWGHATSTDLLHWDHQPVALAPDEIGQIYSGTAVVDHDDTAGFGAGAVVAVFTHAAADGQHQSLAVSTDGGTTWTKHAGNPVLRSPDGLRDFRDPKVLRWTGADGGGGGAGGERWWAMVLAVGSELWLYRSDDLQTWSRSSTLALLDPAEPTVLEVPELVRVPVEGTSRPDEAGGAWRWVLIVSVLPGGPEAEPRWVGWLPVTFDGLTVTPIGAPTLRRLDEGPDIYAPMAWDGDADDGSDGRAPILIGWMNEAEVPANGT